MTTDDGRTGWGEGGQYGPAAAVIDQVLAPKLLNRDATEPVTVWEELYAFGRDFGQKGTYVAAMSALDTFSGSAGNADDHRYLLEPAEGYAHLAWTQRAVDVTTAAVEMVAEHVADGTFGDEAVHDLGRHPTVDDLAGAAGVTTADPQERRHAGAARREGDVRP